METKYIPIIGLEIHIEPNTASKMFCRCPQDHFGKKPNTQTCPVCLGLPGALPFANKEAITKTIKLGLSLGSSISKFSKFYRKNYFYPDLPKAFQTSQLDSPLCVGGELLGKRINHIHLEEDAGKLQHETIDGHKVSLVDFNRGGCALIEIVTEPDFHNVDSVTEFVKEMQLIVRYLGVGTADMEKGSMRLEANVSMSPDGSLPDYKVELKNINSFKFLGKAINAELVRQEKALVAGEKLIQETRGYDEVKQTTFSQRTKAEAHDYRYFPEADLPPMRFSDSQIDEIRKTISELPMQKRKRFAESYDISPAFSEILVGDLQRADYFEEAVRVATKEDISPKDIADLMINKKLDKDYPEPAGFIKRVHELTKVDYSTPDDTLNSVKEVIAEQEKAVNDYKNGNGNVVGFLIGMVQKKLQGKGNVNSVREFLLKELQK